jgi:ABC-type lipoprotein release transport system permease subunit
MVLGYELHQGLKLKVGDKVKLMDREFTVHKLQPQRGDKDDITVFINLKEAQEMLDKRGLINAMLALECHCAADRLSQIRAEIGHYLPDTQVLEYASKALMRAEARNLAERNAKQAVQRAKAEGQAAVAQVEKERAQLRQEREQYAAVVVFVAVLGSALWIALLTLGNVRDRKSEIGILRALGVRSRQVLALFVGKAVLMGVLGAALGFTAAVVVGMVNAPGAPPPIDLAVLGAMLLAAPVLAALASLAPALLAAQQDPALVLHEE